MSELVDSERWAQLWQLFDELVDLAAEERVRHLAAIAARDAELGRDLERLLVEIGDLGVLDRSLDDVFSALLGGLHEPERDKALEQRVGPYRLVEELGRGGMGVVYIAERADGQFEQRVALKLVKRGLDTDEVLERFRRERQILARLEHRSIARLYDGGATEDGRPYFAMELVKGEPITAYCDTHALPIEERLRLLRRVCEAVDHAHRNQVVHRDLKPSNILVTERGDLKLLDFGVAKFLGKGTEGQGAPTLTRIGSRAMTPEYAAPEQVLGRLVSPATDVYALGVTLYELLTGQRPYRLAERSETEVERTILEVEPPRPSTVVEQPPGVEGLPAESLAKARGTTPAALRRRLAGDLDAIVLTALRKEPEQRYGSARALADDLERYLAGQPVTAHSEAPFYRAAKFVRRRRSAVATVGLMALAGAFITYLISRGPRGSDAQAALRLSLGSIRRLTSLPGYEGEPTWSPDGRYVAFSSDASGSFDIWAVPVSGGEAKQLTWDAAEDSEPHWSPDGSTILFRSRREGGGIFAMPASGGDATRLTDFGYRPRWSPDGRRILFQLRPYQRLPNGIAVMDYPGGTARTFLSYEEGKDSYKVADWSPDGRFVVCQSGGWVAPAGLFIQPLRAPSPGFFLQWRGRAIDGISPVWSSRSPGIIFSRSTPGFHRSMNLEFVPLDRDGRVVGPPVRLTTAEDYEPAVSRDGRRLAYSSQTHGGSDLWKVPLDPTTGRPAGEAVQVTRETASELSPAVLPDNRHLLFLSDRDNEWFLYASDLDGRGVKLVDRSHSWQHIESISHDGRWLVLRSSGARGSAYGSYLLPFDPVDLEATGEARWLGDSFHRAISFSPDGKYLLRSSYRRESGLLVSENPTSSNPQQVRWPLSADFLKDYPLQNAPRFSPDGAWVAFGGFKERHKPAVFVVGRGSDTPRLVWEGSATAFWSNHSRRILIWSERGDDTGESLGFVDFDPATGATGSFQRLQLRAAPGGTEIGHYSLTPDEGWLFFAWWEYQGDVFVADLVEG